MRLVVHAPNIHSSGGLTVLAAALSGVPPAQACILLADERLPRDVIPPHVTTFTFPPTPSGRLRAERQLQARATDDDVVLCMGNLPPLFAVRGRVGVYLHNRLLCDRSSLRSFPWRLKARLTAERVWLRQRLTPAVQLIVQTESMRRAALHGLGRDAWVLPCAEALTPCPADKQERQRGHFVYPAGGGPHKNHRVLLAAWQLLREAGVDATLHLTVEKSSPLADVVDQARSTGLAVVNHGHLEKAALACLYDSCAALVYPSLTESFGLPLIEAQAAGLAILAAERDYVRDLVVPDETFDPASAVSIARAVRRFMGEPEPPVSVLAPAVFIDQTLHLLTRQR